METRRSRKKKRWPYILGALFLGIILVIGGTVYYFYDKVEDTFSTMHDPLERDDNPDRKVEIQEILKENNSLNILLLGVDQRPGDKGRSDTMILMSLNPNTDSMLMLSIPRDTYVTIPGRGKDKINHAYAFGDVGLSIQTVEENFNLPVHFYARVNMEGFKEGIDAINGVTLNNDLAFTQGKSQFPVGTINLNGTQALDYIRMRKQDSRGDLGRNDRQRKVVISAIDKAANFSSISKIGNILDIVGNNVKTDLDMKQMTNLFKDYRGTRHNIKTIEVNGSGKTTDRWYYMVTDEEFSRIRNEFIDHMEAE